jgi:hypothetical protein
MMSISKLGSDLSVPADSGMDLAPCHTSSGQVVKASQGHYPQPFLISGKRTVAKIGGLLCFKKYFLAMDTAVYTIKTREQAALYFVIIFIHSNFYYG